MCQSYRLDAADWTWRIERNIELKSCAALEWIVSKKIEEKKSHYFLLKNVSYCKLTKLKIYARRGSRSVSEWVWFSKKFILKSAAEINDHKKRN